MVYDECVKCGREIWDNTPDLTRLIVPTFNDGNYCFPCHSKLENITSIEIYKNKEWEKAKINEYSSDEMEAQK
jgi:hypothetical protein